jgi:glyoxylase-like metal-dependent hydrolase (beta-lactamase superfamily II)
MTHYYALHPATFKLDGGAMFGIIPKPLWEKQIPADELNRIHLSLRVLCIKTDNRVILIDTGIGDYHDPKFAQRFAITGPSDPLCDILQGDLHLKPDQVTDLIVTHLHFDHIGGLAHTPGNFLFPKARIHLHRDHYHYALHPTIRDAGSFQTEYFQPIIEKLIAEERVSWLTGEEGEILTDGNYRLRYKCSHGHTPWLVHPYDSKQIYMADLVPTSAHLPLAWVMGYDIAAGQTTIDKDHFYQFISQENLTMIFEHDINYWGATIASYQASQVKAQKLHPSQGQRCQKLEL